MSLMSKVRSALAIAVASILAMALIAVPAFGEVITSDQAWTVTFTNNAKMESNFNPNDISQMVNDIQPGDTAKIAITLKNDNSDTTNWYMTNKILSSLEESAKSATGGAYEYELSYTSPDKTTTTFFSSDTVGGDNSAGDNVGLHEVADITGDYFLLGSIGNGQSGLVELEVSLDGETQGNSYQDTLADLSMDFAVELNPKANTRTISSDYSLPQTGDDLMDRLPIFFGIAGVGLVILIIAIIGLRKSKKKEQGVQ